LFFDVACLRAFSGTWRSQKDETHFISLYFFITSAALTRVAAVHSEIVS
jgi:hypothetical protein